MTLRDLYAMCDNLDHTTLFTVRAGYLEKIVVDMAPYSELVYFWDKPVKGFKIDGLRYATIYM